jgi:hypothetical protein
LAECGFHSLGVLRGLRELWVVRRV